jgi:tetratricopeptide (TPR) repeat protein/predicted Ser/Thr protein kinase
MAVYSMGAAGRFAEARPGSGDLVDRYLEARLRGALFGEPAETRLGRLRVEGSLGSGGMGTVVLAFDPVLDRHVAIKSVRPERPADGERLIDEARLLAQLDHENVVAVHDVVSEGETVHIVMERVDGESLRSWMAEPRSWREVVPLFAQIGRGLAAAHELDIAHCDVKPENVVVAAGRPRLVDFGLAREGDRGPLGGTEAYLAPERRGGGPGTAAADQYAFFVAMAEAITGERPGPGDELEQLGPRWLRAVVRRGLAPEPGDRFGSMAAAVAALDVDARRSRRRGLGAAAAMAAMAAMAATLAAVVLFRGGADPCGDAAAEIDALWTAERRATIAKTLGERGDRVVRDLDRHVKLWREQRQRSCLDQQRGEQSAAHADFAVRCFEDRLIETRALVDLLSSQPGEEVGARAPEFVAGLDDPRECRDPARTVALPAGAEARARIGALAERLEAARNLERRGDHAGALAALAELTEPARDEAYPPLLSELLALRGAVEVTTGAHDAAEATLREAAEVAAVAKDDHLLAEVWIRLLELLAGRGRHDEALTLEAVASAAVARVDEDRALAARLHNALGGVYLARGEYDDAHAAYEKALALQRAIGADGNRALAPAIANLALARWYRGDLEGALAGQLEALELMVRDLGPDHSSVAYAHQNIGDLLQRLGADRRAEAERHYREALRIWTASLGAGHANLAHPLEQLGFLAKGRGEFEAARGHIAEALRLREAAYGSDHALVLQALVVAIEIESAIATPAALKRAGELVDRAVALKARLGEAGARYGSYLASARADYAMARGDRRAAIAAYRELVSARRAELGAEHRSTAAALVELARAAAHLGRRDLATASLREARAIYRRARAAADVDRELAEIDALLAR